MKLIDFLMKNKEVILPCVALVYSELLSLNPNWKSNGIVQIIGNLLKGSK